MTLINGSLIQAPLNQRDIQGALGVGSGTNKLSQLCTHGNINMWAKYKPEGAATGSVTMPSFNLTLDQRRRNSFGIRCYSQNGYGSLSMLVDALRNNSVRSMFEYIKPSGSSSSPYRELDFNGYYHEAHTPIWAPYNSTDVVDVTQSNTLQLYFYTNVNGTDKEIGLSELKDANAVDTFANYYFGILMWDNSNYYASTQDHVMGSSWHEGLDVTLQNVPMPTGSNTYTYNIVPFFSTLQITSQSATFYGTIFPMTFAKSEVRVGSSARYVSISVWAFVWADDMSTLRFRWAVSNMLSGQFTFSTTGINQSYITIGTPSQSGTYGYWGVNINEQIPAETSRSGDVVIASNLLAAQQEFIRNGDTYVSVTAARPNATYNYTGIIQIWER